MVSTQPKNTDLSTRSAKLAPKSLRENLSHHAGSQIVTLLDTPINIELSSASRVDRLWRRQSLSVNFTTRWETFRKIELRWHPKLQILFNLERRELTSKSGPLFCDTQSG
jgi:hypothetical protein